MYKVQGTDGRQYGPVSAEILRDWITQGRVNAQTMIQAEGSTDWRPVAQFPEFAPALGAPRPPVPAVPPVPSPSSPAPLSAPQPSGAAKTSGLAIASLVLGLVTFPTCGLAGLVGLILGIFALVKISNSAGRLE